MKIDLIPVAHQKQYKKILEYINAYKNGVTSDSMQAYGIVYEKNYGASMISLRRIAERFPHNHDFANLLWKKKWRETYILSTLLDTPESYTPDILNSRIKECPTLEILEQLAFNIAWQLNFLDEYFAQTQDRTSKEMLYFLVKSTTYQIIKKKITAQNAFKRISTFSFSDNVAILNILQNLLFHIITIDENLKSAIVTFCLQHEGNSWKTIAKAISE